MTLSPDALRSKKSRILKEANSFVLKRYLKTRASLSIPVFLFSRLLNLYGSRAKSGI
jgi:hypothetical protein